MEHPGRQQDHADGEVARVRREVRRAAEEPVHPGGCDGGEGGFKKFGRRTFLGDFAYKFSAAS